MNISLSKDKVGNKKDYTKGSIILDFHPEMAKHAQAEGIPFLGISEDKTTMTLGIEESCRDKFLKEFEIYSTIRSEDPIATKVIDMGTEKDGLQCILYHSRTSLGAHWFVIPDNIVKEDKLKYEEKAQRLVNWLEIN